MVVSDQKVQHALIRDTGNGPTMDAEDEILRAKYGDPDEDGVYGKPEENDVGA